MKFFDNPIEAVREVKRLSKEINDFEDIYICYNEMSERFYVSDDAIDIEEQIRKGFDGGDSADSHARMFQVWQYNKACRKEKYPSTYRYAKRSIIEGLIRKKNEVEPEYSVSFNIS
jgi:hypothetical protein